MSGSRIWVTGYGYVDAVKAGAMYDKEEQEIDNIVQGQSDAWDGGYIQGICDALRIVLHEKAEQEVEYACTEEESVKGIVETCEYFDRELAGLLINKGLYHEKLTMALLADLLKELDKIRNANPV